MFQPYLAALKFLSRKSKNHFSWRKMIFTLFGCGLCFGFLLPAAASAPKKSAKKTAQSSSLKVQNNIDYTKLAAPNISHLLGWVKDPSPKNICGGYYKDPAFIVSHPQAPPLKTTPTTITAKKQALFSQYGVSTLTGDVTISQPGRQVVANKVTLKRDKKTGKLADIDLQGDVKLREYGKLVVAQHGHMALQKKTTTLNDAIYRINLPTPSGHTLGAWGKAKRVFRDHQGVFHLTKASYSTCPPEGCTWHIVSNHLTLNKKTGRGSAVNTVLYAKKLPVAYFPYLNFPLDHRRKSGFLYPTITSSSSSGIGIALPYYFNLAPNYDFTLTPELISRRGIFIDGLFRYLTKRDQGNIEIGFIPHDKKFAFFQKDAINQYPNGSPHALSKLANDSSSRGFIKLFHATHFNQHWHDSLHLNYVSDDYFQQDFHNISDSTSPDQLLNQADLNYDNEHWHFLGRMQAFQTLHPLTYSGNEDQYMRLPQLNLNAVYPEEAFGLSYKVNSQFVHFDHKKDFETGAPVTTGNRFLITPSISLPLNWASAYILPKLDLATIQYSLKNQPINNPAAIGQAVPIFSFDSGLFFSRSMTFFGQNYNQTLEPRLYYLYVPKRDQNELPVFDTTLPVFNFETLFRNNRFTGVDRIGDANQVALALTTRFLDDYTGEEKLRASIGQIYLFHKHQVCLNNDCSSDPLAKNRISPLVGEMQYAINPAWKLTANAAWDPSGKFFNNDAIGIQYHSAQNRILNLGYNFVRNGDSFQGVPKSLNRIDFSFAWPISRHWHILGDWNYNISYIHPQTYFYGIEYENCCFAIRLIQSQNFLSVDANHNLRFEKQIYLQFLFKGLGAIGSSGTKNLLSGRIANFQDHFATRFGE